MLNRYLNENYDWKSFKKVKNQNTLKKKLLLVMLLTHTYIYDINLLTNMKQLVEKKLSILVLYFMNLNKNQLTYNKKSIYKVFFMEQQSHKKKRKKILFSKWKIIKRMYRGGLKFNIIKHPIFKSKIKKTIKFYKQIKYTKKYFQKSTKYNYVRKIKKTFIKSFIKSLKNLNTKNSTIFFTKNKYVKVTKKNQLLYYEILKKINKALLKRMKKLTKKRTIRYLKIRRKTMLVRNKQFNHIKMNLNFKIKLVFKKVYHDYLYLTKSYNVITKQKKTPSLKSKYVKNRIYVSLFKDKLIQDYIHNFKIFPTCVLKDSFFRRNFNFTKNITTLYNLETNHINNNKWISNYTPLYNYNVFSKNTNKIQNLHKSKENNLLLYISYFMLFLESYLKTKIWLKAQISNTLSNFWKNYVHNFLRFYKNTTKKQNKLINIKQLTQLIVLMFKTKDVQMFLFFVKKYIEASHFKNHKKILNIIFDIIHKNKALMDLTNTKGFSFDIRGKVGVSGNAKKRHIFFSIGKISTASQNLKAQWQQIDVWTPTGQMGVTCLIQF